MLPRRPRTTSASNLRRSSLAPTCALSLAIAGALLFGAACGRKGDDAADGVPPATGAIDAGAAPDAPSDVARDTRAEDERAGWLDAGRFCGDGKLQPDCPMQAWMKKHASSMLGFGDIGSIADVFDRIGRLMPDELGPDGRPVYANWRSISDDGAAAARAGDIPAAKAACRGCHVQYLRLYQRTVRGRPIAESP